MASLNEVRLIGNLGQDPERRAFNDGTAVANLSIATTESYKDKSGERKEVTDWHRVQVIGQMAEFICQYGKKGRSLLVCGRLKTQKYTDKNGVEKQVTVIRADSIQLLDRPSQAGQGQGNSAATPRASAQEPSPKPQPPVSTSTSAGFDDDDDIPW